MHIVIVGAGGVGANYGGYIARAGIPVTFIARGEHLKTMQKDGLTIENPAGNFTIQPTQATDNPSTVKNADVIFVCTKSWQLESTFDAIQAMLGPKTFVIPLQNSVDACDLLAARFGKERVVGGLCYTVSYIVRPGVVHGDGERIIFGELNHTVSERTQELFALLKSVPGITAKNSDNIHYDMWKKFVWIASAGAIGAVTRSPVGIWRKVPETRQLFEAVLREAFQVAVARGVAMGDKEFAEVMSFVDARPDGFRTSMQRDVEAGARSELIQQIGTVVRLGAELKVAAPISAAVFAALLPQELRAQGKVSFSDKMA